MNVTLAVVLFALGVLAFLGAWLVAATNVDPLGSENHLAWMSAGGFFATCGFLVERAR
jgi:monomeric isocitrate dehydrogenase